MRKEKHESRRVSFLHANRAEVPPKILRDAAKRRRFQRHAAVTRKMLQLYTLMTSSLLNECVMAIPPILLHQHPVAVHHCSTQIFQQTMKPAMAAAVVDLGQKLAMGPVLLHARSAEVQHPHQPIDFHWAQYQQFFRQRRCWDHLMLRRKPKAERSLE